MEANSFKVYRYRWIVLLGYMGVVAINQLLWINFAAITGSAATFYHVSDLSIGLLSMVFMIVYILISIPASWAIDTYGIVRAVGIGAVLTGVFGLLRGLLASSYTLVFVSQIGIAAGQPFILNAATKVAARWFPLNERATAAGLGSLAIYLGIMIGLALTPWLAVQTSLTGMLLIYGIVAVVAALMFFILVKENPPSPPCPPGQEERSLPLEGLRTVLRQREFLLLMVVFWVGLGVFNSVTTWIEEILKPNGFTSEQAGLAGGLMIAGGILGALFIPALSDRSRRRVPYIILAVTGATIGLAGLAFSTNNILLLVSAFTMGFFLLSSGPIGFQYGAEVTFPAPEAASNGLLLLMGQVSGILFIFGMDALKDAHTGSMAAPLLGLLALMVVALVICTQLKEAPLLQKT